jgi:hypothetical protein
MDLTREFFIKNKHLLNVSWTNGYREFYDSQADNALFETHEQAQAYVDEMKRLQPELTEVEFSIATLGEDYGHLFQTETN